MGIVLMASIESTIAPGVKRDRQEIRGSETALALTRFSGRRNRVRRSQTLATVSSGFLRPTLPFPD
jgi:hypothetical protein